MAEYLGFEPTKSSKYYFVSYNSQDAKRISSIAKQLAADGMPLWYDYDLEYGAMWEQQITERIMNSEAVILFFTKGIFVKEQSGNKLTPVERPAQFPQYFPGEMEHSTDCV